MKSFLSSHKFFLLLIVIFVLLRLPSLFEGFWYVDEGFYATQAEAILRGKELYLEAWDHKPPLMVWIYLVGGFFGWFWGYPIIKLLSILMGIVVLVLLQKLLTKEKIEQKLKSVLLFITILLLGTPLLEGNLANSELFFIPITTSILYLSLYKRKPTLTGVLLTMSFLIKPQAFIESIAIIASPLIYVFVSKKNSKKRIFDKEYYLKLLATFAVLVGIYTIYLLIKEAFLSFADAVFLTNLVYIETEDGATKWNVVKVFFAGAFFLVMIFKARIQKFSRSEFTVFTVVALNVLLISLSGRPYPHYLIQIIPSMIISLALLSRRPKISLKKLLSISATFVVTVLFLFSRGLDVELLDESRLRGHSRYYIDFPAYLAGDRSTESWFWRNHISNDWTKEFIDHFEENYSGIDYYYYGEQPWIFTQLEGDFVNKYLVWYHLDYSDEKMKEGIIASNKAMIVIVDEYSRRKRPQFFKNLEMNFTILEQVHNYTIYANNEY